MAATQHKLLTVLGNRAIFNPANVSNVMALWYKASTVVGKTNGASLAASDVLDQSTNARNAATASNITYSTNSIGTKPALTFTRASSSYLLSAAFVQAAPFTVYLVIKGNNLATDQWMFDGIGTNNLAAIAKYNAVSPSTRLTTVFAPVTGGAWPGEGNVIKAIFNGAATKISTNLYAPVTGNPGTRSLNGITLGGTGELTAGFFYNGDMAEIIIYSGAVSNADDDSILKPYFAAQYGSGLTLQTRTNPLVVCYGDSLTAGSQSTGFTNDYPHQMWATLGRSGYQMCNMAMPGYTSVQLASAAAADVDPLLNASASKNICVIWCGINDIGGGATGLATYNSIVGLHNARRTAGWKTIACTITPDGDGSFTAGMEVIRQSVNASILTNWATFSDAVVDLAGDGRLSNPANTTYYQSDKLHMTDTGYGVVGSLVDAAVVTL